MGLLAGAALLLGVTACGSDDESESTPTVAAVEATTGEAATPDETAAAADDESTGDVITVGFVAVGPEGAWRAANEANIKETFSPENGFDLKYAPATNLDQKSQIDVSTPFVDEGVDVILLSATEGAGWGRLPAACPGGRDPGDPHRSRHRA